MLSNFHIVLLDVMELIHRNRLGKGIYFMAYVLFLLIKKFPQGLSEQVVDFPVAEEQIICRD